VCGGLALASALCLVIGLTRDVPGATGSCPIPIEFTPWSDQAIQSRTHWWELALLLAAACPAVIFAGAFFNEPPGRYWKAAIALLVLPLAVLVTYPAIIVCAYN
jgi:hypothetical protein